MRLSYRLAVPLGVIGLLWVAKVYLDRSSIKDPVEDPQPPQNAIAEASPGDRAGAPTNATEVALPRRPQQIAPFNQDLFTKRFGAGWLFSSTEDGVWTSLSGGKIPLTAIDRQSLLQLGQELAPYLGVNKEQVVSPPRQSSETEYGSNHLIDQTFEGWPVFESHLRLYVSKTDSAVTIIDNQLKPISQPELKQKYSLEEAQTFLLGRFSGSRISGTPLEVVYADEGQGQLAYRFYVQTSDDDLLVVISAQDLRILVQRSERIE